MSNSHSPFVTLSQLQQHDGVKNAQLWILLYGKVYDVSEFADKHPGGREMIESACARNSTALFESYHLSSQSIARVFLRDDNPMIKYIGDFDDNNSIEASNQDHSNNSLNKVNFTDYNTNKSE